MKTLKLNKKVTELTIKLFNKAMQLNNTVEFGSINKIAVKKGYIVHPDVCNDDVYSFISTIDTDYNATFYKNWDSIISKNRFELYLDQIQHYASTYGTNYTGEVYLPSDSTLEVPDFKNFKVILPITIDEVIERCTKMLYSGIALKQETIDDLLCVLNSLSYKIDVNLVRNKEAKMLLYHELNQLPTEPSEMVRFLVYLATGKTLLIKDGFTISTIKNNMNDISEYIKRFGYEKLASVFYRFKPIFLAFRTTADNRVAINKLRRLAKTNHVPLKKSYFEDLLNNPSLISELPSRVKTLNNFKKISLLQTILIRQKELDKKVFVVRNQKLFIKTDSKTISKDYYQQIYDIIYSELIVSLKAKSVDKDGSNVTFNTPSGVNLTLPTSEKSFIGNYPIGTSFDFSTSDNIVGINWKQSEGASDIDLSLMSIDGQKYGWNANYKNSNNSIVYSGDMTSANPQATELFYASKDFNPSIVKVNLFNGSSNSKFKFFIAKEKINNLGRNYMVDPNNILFTIDCEMDSKEKSLGVITDTQFILAQFRTGKGAVSYNSVTDLYTEYALSTIDCYLNLETVLLEAGFIKSDVNPSIDLNSIAKDTLIDIFS